MDFSAKKYKTKIKLKLVTKISLCTVSGTLNMSAKRMQMNMSQQSLFDNDYNTGFCIYTGY